jgi:hypothetical protein
MAQMAYQRVRRGLLGRSLVRLLRRNHISRRTSCSMAMRTWIRLCARQVALLVGSSISFPAHGSTFLSFILFSVRRSALLLHGRSTLFGLYLGKQWRCMAEVYHTPHGETNGRKNICFRLALNKALAKALCTIYLIRMWSAMVLTSVYHLAKNSNFM